MEFDQYQYEIVHAGQVLRAGRCLIITDASPTSPDTRDCYSVFRVQTDGSRIEERRRVFVGTAQQVRGFLTAQYLDGLGAAIDAQITLARRKSDPEFRRAQTAGLIPISTPQLAVRLGDTPGEYQVIDLESGDTIYSGDSPDQTLVAMCSAVIDDAFAAVSDAALWARAADWRERIDAAIPRVVDIAREQAWRATGVVNQGNGKSIILPPMTVPPREAELLALFEDILAGAQEMASEIARIMVCLATLSDGTGRPDPDGMPLVRALARARDNGLGDIQQQIHLIANCRKWMRLYQKYSHKGDTVEQRADNRRYFWGMLGKMARGEAAITRAKGEVQYIMRAA